MKESDVLGNPGEINIYTLVPCLHVYIIFCKDRCVMCMDYFVFYRLKMFLKKMFINLLRGTPYTVIPLYNADFGSGEMLAV